MSFEHRTWRRLVSHISKLDAHRFNKKAAATLGMAAIQALDVSSCGLGQKDLGILTKPINLTDQIRVLDISKNLHRLPLTHLPNILLGLKGVKELNLRGSLRAGVDVVESLFPFKLLQNLQELEVLDISGLKVPAPCCLCPSNLF